MKASLWAAALAALLAGCAGIAKPGAPPAMPASLSSANAPDSRPGTTYDTGPDLGTRLMQNVVRIDARDLGEHGFGLVVGSDATHVYLVTARHVIAKRPPAGLDGPERASQDIALGFCALPASTALQPAEMLGSFDGADDDLALLRTALPKGYAPQTRALTPTGDAPTGGARTGEMAWQLGRESDCTVQPTPGLVAAAPDARQNLRIDLHGVLGGSSGGPVVSGRGIVGLTKRSDNEKITAHAIADVQRRVLAVAGTPFTLVDARNLPPGDPQAAVSDLTESLRAYLFGARDLQGFLRQDVVPRATFARLVQNYTAGVQRFRDARDKHDGTLKTQWTDDVMPEWATLRDALWKIHLVFFGLNGDTAKAITATEHSPPAVQAQMASLEPDLVALQASIDHFATDLSTKRKPP